MWPTLTFGPGAHTPATNTHAYLTWGPRTRRSPKSFCEGLGSTKAVNTTLRKDPSETRDGSFDTQARSAARVHNNVPDKGLESEPLTAFTRARLQLGLHNRTLFVLPPT